jgi:hypothetical protein
MASSQHDIFFSIEKIVMGILADSYVLVVLRASLKGKRIQKWRQRKVGIFSILLLMGRLNG